MRMRHGTGMRRRLASRACRQLMLTLGGVAILASSANASCNPIKLADRVRDADAIFLGRPIGHRPSFVHPLYESVVTFEVTRVWKGGREGRVDVVTDGSSLPFMKEGYPTGFGRDTSYLVFAWRLNDGTLIGGFCSGTIPTLLPKPEEQAYIDSALRDFHQMAGPGVPALAAAALSTDDVVWLMAGGTVAAAVWVRRRKRRRRGAG
jgi:hypothetical protein